MMALKDEYYLQQRKSHNRNPLRLSLNETEVIIGRKSFKNRKCSLHVSRKHASFQVTTSGSWFVKDLDSTNGIFINGRKISQTLHQLCVNDIVSFGAQQSDEVSNEELEFVFCCKSKNTIAGMVERQTERIHRPLCQTTDSTLPQGVNVKTEKDPTIGVVAQDVESIPSTSSAVNVMKPYVSVSNDDKLTINGYCPGIKIPIKQECNDTSALSDKNTFMPQTNVKANCDIAVGNISSVFLKTSNASLVHSRLERKDAKPSCLQTEQSLSNKIKTEPKEFAEIKEIEQVAPCCSDRSVNKQSRGCHNDEDDIIVISDDDEDNKTNANVILPGRSSVGMLDVHIKKEPKREVESTEGNSNTSQSSDIKKSHGVECSNFTSVNTAANCDVQNSKNLPFQNVQVPLSSIKNEPVDVKVEILSVDQTDSDVEEELFGYSQFEEVIVISDDDDYLNFDSSPNDLPNALDFKIKVERCEDDHLEFTHDWDLENDMRLNEIMKTSSDISNNEKVDIATTTRENISNKPGFSFMEDDVHKIAISDIRSNAREENIAGIACPFDDNAGTSSMDKIEGSTVEKAPLEPEDVNVFEFPESESIHNIQKFLTLNTTSNAKKDEEYVSKISDISNDDFFPVLSQNFFDDELPNAKKTATIGESHSKHGSYKHRTSTTLLTEPKPMSHRPKYQRGREEWFEDRSDSNLSPSNFYSKKVAALPKSSTSVKRKSQEERVLSTKTPKTDDRPKKRPKSDLRKKVQAQMGNRIRAPNGGSAIPMVSNDRDEKNRKHILPRREESPLVPKCKVQKLSCNTSKTQPRRNPTVKQKSQSSRMDLLLQTIPDNANNIQRKAAIPTDKNKPTFKIPKIKPNVRNTSNSPANKSQTFPKETKNIGSSLSDQISRSSDVPISSRHNIKVPTNTKSDRVSVVTPVHPFHSNMDGVKTSGHSVSSHFNSTHNNFLTSNTNHPLQNDFSYINRKSLLPSSTPSTYSFSKGIVQPTGVANFLHSSTPGVKSAAYAENPTRTDAITSPLHDLKSSIYHPKTHVNFPSTSVQKNTNNKTGGPLNCRDPRLRVTRDLQGSNNGLNAISKPTIQVPPFNVPNNRSNYPPRDVHITLVNKLSTRLDSDALVTEIIKHWHPSWLKEYTNIGRPPSVVTKGVIPLPLAYSSLDQYATCFYSMMRLELWESIYVDWKDYSEKNLMCLMVTECLAKGDIMVLDCESLVNDHISIREGSLLIVDLREKNRKEVIKVFGYVSSLKSHPRNNNSLHKEWQRRPEFLLNDSVYYKFSLKTKKKTIALELDKLVKVTVVSYIANRLRLADVFQYLMSSPVTHCILKPTEKAFSIGQHDSASSQSLALVGNYNKKQKFVIASIRREISEPYLQPKVLLLQGPPGTGKTHTIVGIVQALLQGEKGKSKILITAPSNAAVDEIGRRLISLKKKHSRSLEGVMKIVRVGLQKQIHPDLQPYSLDELTRRNSKISSMNEVETLKKTLSQKIGLIEKLQLEVNVMTNRCLPQEAIKSKMGELSMETRRKQHVEEELKNAQRRVLSSGFAQDYGCKIKILKNASIVLSTLSSCRQRILESSFGHRADTQFTCCIIDEATQATEPELLQPLVFGICKFIIVGDHQQLPATVQSKLAIDCHYERSMFERIHLYFEQNHNVNPVFMLTDQYRMHSDICSFPSSYFYSGKLKTSSEVNDASKNFPIQPFTVLNITSSQESNTLSSKANVIEAKYILEVCKHLVDVVQKNVSIGLITPYQGQRNLYTREFSFHSDFKDIEVNTVDGFQGREKDIIVVSCVRARSASGGIGFLTCRKRLNVAITRARHCLIICGHMNSFGNDPTWSDLLKCAKDMKCLKTITDIQDISFVISEMRKR